MRRCAGTAGSSAGRSPGAGGERRGTLPAAQVAAGLAAPPGGAAGGAGPAVSRRVLVLLVRGPFLLKLNVFLAWSRGLTFVANS